MRVIFGTLISIGLLGSLLFGASAVAAGIEAQLDRTRLAEGETLVLTLSAPGDVSGTPVLTPLEQDFDLLNQNQSNRLSIINGKRSSTREWQLVLAPKHTGRLKIPSLQIGGMSSPALSVEVLPAAQAAKLGEPQPLLLEVEATPNDPYVQSEVIYTLRVLARVSLQQASLSVPKIDDAIVERLGEDKEYKTYRDGQQYQVIERRYAIYPQHSGRLKIDAPLLSAQVPEPGQQRKSLRQRMFGGQDPFADLFGRDPFSDMGGLFQQLRPMQVRGRSLSLDVRPQPANTATPWLPAESLTLAESWSPNPPLFRVGEPVTRTIAITAQGLSDAQLPDLNPAVPDGIKVYPDKPQSETRVAGATLVAQKVIKSALLPSRAGELTLPEVRLDWWDTQSNQQQTAILPARRIQVLPGTAATDESQVLTPAASPAARPATSTETQAAEPLSALNGDAMHGLSQLGQVLISRSRLPAGYWPWISALLALAWLISTGLWLRARSAAASGRSVKQDSAAGKPTAQPHKVLARVERACLANDAKAVRQALLEWAAACWPDNPPQRLESLGQRLDDAAAGLLRRLDQTLYAAEAKGWDGTEFWRRLAPALKGAGHSEVRAMSDSVLPPLYPQQAG